MKLNEKAFKEAWTDMVKISSDFDLEKLHQHLSGDYDKSKTTKMVITILKQEIAERTILCTQQ